MAGGGREYTQTDQVLLAEETHDEIKINKKIGSPIFNFKPRFEAKDLDLTGSSTRPQRGLRKAEGRSEKRETKKAQVE